MEAIIALAGGALAAGVIFGLKKLGAILLLQKYGAVISKTFDVIDPIAGDLIGSYEGSTFQEALELAVYRVSDSKIDEKDVLAITKYVASKFSPSIAASKALDPETEEGKVSLEIADKVKALTDGVDKGELIGLVRSALPLVTK